MTFTDIVNEVADRLNIRTTAGTARIGKTVNRYNRQITASIGLQPSRRTVSVVEAMTQGAATVTFDGLEKITRVVDDSTGEYHVLQEVTWDEIRDVESNTDTDGPTKYAIERMASDFVTIRTDWTAQDTRNLKADGYSITGTLSGTDEPPFAESFHYLLIEGALIDEYKKLGQLDMSKDSRVMFERGLSDLRMFIAKSGYLKTRQGERRGQTRLVGGGAGSGDSSPGALSYTQTGVVIFDTLFQIADADAAVIQYLNADKLDGQHGAYYLDRANHTGSLGAATGLTVTATDRLLGRDTAGVGAVEELTVGGGVEFSGSGGIRRSALTGDVTAAAGSNATTIANSAVTYAKMQDVSAASKLLGRGTAGSNAVREITLGSNLSMSGDTLNASSAGAAGSDTQVMFNDGGSLGGDAGLVYNKTTNQLTVDLLNLLGGQIAFPSTPNPSSNANTLDEYEEGNWTPVLGGAGGTSGQSYSTQIGRYIKIGKLVFCSFRATLSNEGTITGALQLQGLPFTTDTTGSFTTSFAISWESMATNYVNLTGHIEPNTTYCTIRGYSAAAASSGGLDVTSTNNTSQMLGSFCYVASA